MKSTCEEARNWVPRALMSDLAPQEEQALNAHLAECPACASEQRLYMDTLGQVRAVSDCPVPRHFFVYPDERGSSVMEFLRGLAPGWKLAASVAVLTMAVFAGLDGGAASIPSGAGSLYLQFWPPSCHRQFR